MYVYCSVSLCQKYFTVLNVLHKHPRLVGKRCQVAGESLVSDVEVGCIPLPFSVRLKFGVQPNLAKTTTAGGQNEYDGQEGAAECSSSGPGQLTGK